MPTHPPTGTHPPCPPPHPAVGSVPELVLKHPRIFEYKLTPSGRALAKGAARIKVDTVPTPTGEVAVAINYFRENAAFMESPVSPMPPTEK
jgi:hypothetical protein